MLIENANKEKIIEECYIKVGGKKYSYTNIRNMDNNELTDFLSKFYDEAFNDGHEKGYEEGSEEAEIQYQESWDDIPGPLSHWSEE